MAALVIVRLQQLLLATGFLILVGSLWIAATVSSRNAIDIGRDVDVASRSFDQAQFRKDRDVLDRFLAPDMKFIRGSGVAAGKSEFMTAFTDPATVFISFDIRDRDVTVLGDDAAIVSAEATIRGSSAGEPFEEHIRYSDLFARRDGILRVVHVQVTPLGRS